MLKDLLKKIVPIRDEEVGASLLAFAYGFCIFLSYQVLRPVRDEISAEQRPDLRILWAVVFGVMLLAAPIYSKLVSRYPRGVFIPLVYRFFIANILAFIACLLLLPDTARAWIDRVFYVWLSVFNLFVVTVFWGFMADLFRNEQGKRLFGLLAAGVSLGGIVGAGYTGFFGDDVPVYQFMIIAVVPLEMSCWCARALHHKLGVGKSAAGRQEDQPIIGTAFTGIQTVWKSPYLRKIALYLVILTFANTVLYMAQSDLVREVFPDRSDRRAFLGRLDLAVNLLTIFAQSVLFARLVRGLGISVNLALIPILMCMGLLAIGLFPVLAVVAVVQILYRSGRYAIAKPAREVLFTVVGREEKYKSKSFIDTAVYRGGDLASSQVNDYLRLDVGLSLSVMAFLAAPVGLIWAGLGIVLGRQQEDLAVQGSVAPERDEDSPG